MTVLPLPQRLARIAGTSVPPEPSIPQHQLGDSRSGRNRQKVREETCGWRAAPSSPLGHAHRIGPNSFAAENGIPFHGTYEDVLSRDDVDAVYVATTHNFHIDGALEAIAAGKPVLIEKPIVRNSAELRRLRAAAEEANVLVMEAMSAIPASLHDHPCGSRQR